MSQPIVDEGRPRPLLDAASWAGKVYGISGALLTALAGYGVLSTAQGDALVGLWGAIPGVVTLVVSVLTAFGVVRRGEPMVTPLSDPVDNEGRSLRAAGPMHRA